MNNYRTEVNNILLAPEIVYSQIKVGSSWYLDDLWETDGFSGKIRLSNYDELPIFKEQVRRFFLEKYRKNSFATLCSYYHAVNFFYNFLRENFPTISKFEDLNELVINYYLYHVLEYKKTVVRKNEKKGESGLSPIRIIKYSKVVVDILEFSLNEASINISDELLSYAKNRRQEIILESPLVNKKNKKPTTKREYKQETIANILSCAYKDEDLYLRAIMMVGSQLGLRISEILTIETGFIKGTPGKYFLGYITSKTKKGEVYVEKPANDIVIECLLDLCDFTKPIRKRLGTKKIFVISKYGGSLGFIRNSSDFRPGNLKTKDVYIKKSNVNRDFIQPFIERWDIREDGELIDLSSHYNRHFFAHLSWIEGLSVNSIRYMLNHDSFKMTATYMYNAEKSMKEKFKAMMSSPELMAGKKVGDYQEKLKKHNCFKGKTEKQLDAIIGVMNVQILPNGACMHHPLKAEQRLQQCSRKCDGCDKFVTHECYKDVHKIRIARLERIMEDSLAKGNQVWYDRTKRERDYVYENYIKPFE